MLDELEEERCSEDKKEAGVRDVVEVSGVRPLPADEWTSVFTARANGGPFAASFLEDELAKRKTVFQPCGGECMRGGGTST